MKRLKDSRFYKEAFTELNFSFGDFYLFENFIVAEISENVVFSWEHHAKKLTEELDKLYGDKGASLVYISHRVNAYSVQPSDWLNFFKHGYTLQGYAIVNYTKRGLLNSTLEKLFMGNKLRSFESLDEAVYWAKYLGLLAKKQLENAK